MKDPVDGKVKPFLVESDKSKFGDQFCDDSLNGLAFNSVESRVHSYEGTRGIGLIVSFLMKWREEIDRVHHAQDSRSSDLHPSFESNLSCVSRPGNVIFHVPKKVPLNEVQYFYHHDFLPLFLSTPQQTLHS